MSIVKELNIENLDELVEAINSEGEYAEEYYASEDYGNDLAYYATESDHDDIIKASIEDLDDEVREKAERMIERHSAKKIVELLVENGEMLYATDYYNRWNEAWSMPMGERDWQLQDELIERLYKLNKEELDYVEKNTDHCLKDNWLYINLDYNRWYLKTDEDCWQEVFKALEPKHLKPLESAWNGLKKPGAAKLILL